MVRLDAEGAHLGRGEIDGNVVLLGAEHGLAGIGHIHRKSIQCRRHARGDKTDQAERCKQHRRGTHDNVLRQGRTA
jgi:hypothetical protein